MIAFNNPRNRIEKKSTAKNKSHLKSFNEISATDPLKVTSEILDSGLSRKFESLDEIFQPIENGRTITARRLSDGVRIDYLDGIEPLSPSDDFLEVLKNSGATVYEFSSRFASLLVANDEGDGSSKPSYVVRWQEHRRPDASEPSRSWALITADVKFWRSIVFATGHKWRMRLTEPQSFLLPPHMYLDHACVTDGDED